MTSRIQQQVKQMGGGVISHIQYALKEECVLHPHALKGQKLLAQGIALGICGCKLVALKGQKLSIPKLLPFQGDFAFCKHYPGRCPGLGAFGLSARPRLPLSRLMTHPHFIIYFA